MSENQWKASKTWKQWFSNWKRWNRADKIAFAALLVAFATLLATILAIPGMPNIFHSGSGSSDAETNPTSVLMTFDNVPTENSIGYAPAADYLNHYGLHISQLSQGEVVVLNQNASYDGLAFTAPSSPNVLTQVDCSGASSFTLKLDRPAQKIQFWRARLIAVSKYGISHPAWHVVAFDEHGNQLDTVAEQMIKNIGTGNNADQRQFTLIGPDIASIQVSSDNRTPDGKPHAAFCSVLLDNLSITY